MGKVLYVAVAAVIFIAVLAFVGAEVYNNLTTESKVAYNKTTDSIYPNIYIKTSMKNVSEYFITENTANCLTNCYMRGNATLYETGKLFDGFNMSDLKKEEFTGDKPSLRVQIKTGTIKNTVQETIFKEYCVDKSINASGKTCGMIVDKIINVTNEVEVWSEYDFKDKLPGTYEWRIYGIKDAYVDIDIIPIVRGLAFTEWATWTSSFNTNLNAYYDFTNDSATNIPEKINGRVNLTIASGACGMNSSAGKVGIGLGGIGTSACTAYNTAIPKELPVTMVTKNDNVTVAFWYNANSNLGTGVEMWIMNIGSSITSGAGDKGMECGVRVNTNIFQCWGNYWDVGNTEIAYGNGAQVANSWVFLVLKRENGTIYSYVNGTKQSFTKAYANNLSASTNYFQFFRREAGATYFKANVDELGFWNRALTDSEIWDLYNNGTGLTYSSGEAPPTNTCTYSGTGDWNVLCSDGCNISTTVQLGGNLNISNSSGGGYMNVSSLINFTITGKNVYIYPKCELRVEKGGRLGQ